MSAAADAPVEKSGGMLDAIERIGNKVPHPAILFIALCGIVIVLSQILYWADVKVTYQVATPPPVTAQDRYDGGSSAASEVLGEQHAAAKDYEIKTQTARVEGLLTTKGIRFLFTSFVSNFRNFAAVAIILIVMIGVGLAEAAGLIGALIRKLVAVSSERMLTPIIVFAGVISSIASDAGYLATRSAASPSRANSPTASICT